jgi:hypothetical protein
MHSRTRNFQQDNLEEEKNDLGEIKYLINGSYQY